MRRCPRCQTDSLQPGAGAVSEDVCGSCGGRFLPSEVTERVVVDELGFERELLRDIADLFSGLKLNCPGCPSTMRPLRLRGVVVDLCFSCGGLWLDRGELTALTGGRHEELGGSADDAGVGDNAPVVVGRPSSTVRLGRGDRVVVFESLDAPNEKALQRAFSRTDGLTNHDAQMLTRHNNGVVVEGVSDEGAAGLRAVLAAEGVGADVVRDFVFRLPPAVQTSDFTVDESAITARLHTGAPFSVPWPEVVAVVGGVVTRERLERRTNIVPFGFTKISSAGPDLPQPDTTSELVRSDDVVVDLLQVGTTLRRLRLVPTPGRERAQASADNLARLCLLAAKKTAVGRGPGAAVLPSYRRPRELERELAWVGWRAARWPPTS